MTIHKKHIIHFVKTVTERAVYIILGVILFLILITASIRLPFVQHVIVNKVEIWASKKLDTEFQLKNLYINFPTTINLQYLYLEDLSGDTLLYFDDLRVDMNLFALLNHRIKMSNVRLYQANANLIKNKADSTFNFQFIIDRLGSQSKENGKSKSEWEIVLGGTELNNVKFQYIDSIQNTRLRTIVGKLDVDLDNINLDDMSFEVDDIVLENSNVDFFSKPNSSDTIIVVNDTSSSPNLNTILNNINIKNSQVHLNDTYNNILINAGEVKLEKGTFDLQRQLANCEAIKILNSSFDQETLRTDSSIEKQNTPAATTIQPWTANVSSAMLENNTVSIDNKLMPHQPEGFDKNHIKVQNLSGSIKNINYRGSTIAANCETLSFNEQSGIELRKLQSAFKISDNSIDVEDLFVHVNQSKLRGSARFYPKDFLNDTSSTMASSFNIKEAVVQSNDILNVMPALQKDLPKNLRLQFKTAISGKLSSLTINHFNASLDSIDLSLHGMINGLPNINHTKFILPDVQLTAVSNALKRVLPDTLLPKNLNIPDSVILKADINGYWFKGKNKVNFMTNYGNANFQSEHTLDTTTNNLELKAHADISNFRLNRLLQNNKLGRLDGNLTFDSRGQFNQFPIINVNGNIDTIQYNNYTYNGIQIDGTIQKNAFDGSLKMKSEDLDFNYQGGIALTDSTTSGQFKLNVNHADLLALNITKTPYNIKGYLITNATLDQSGHVNGKASFRNINILKNNDFYKVDSIDITSESSSSSTKIQVQSDVLSADINGNIDIIKLPGIIRNHIQQYFTDSLKTKPPHIPEDKRIDFDLSINEKELTTNILIPGLEDLRITEFHGFYDEAKNELFAKITAPKITYRENTLDTLTLEIVSDSSSFRSNLGWSTLSNNYLSVKNFTLQANSEKDALQLSLTVPGDKVDLLHLAGKLYQKDSSYYFSFYPEHIVFNGTNWNIPEDNHIGISGGLDIKNLSFKRKEHEFSIYTMMQNGDSTLNVQFKNFNLNNLSNALSISDTLLTGVLNGNFQMITSATGLAMNTDIDIDKLSYYERQIGHLTLKSNYQNQQNTFKLNIEGDSTKLLTEGNFKTGDELQYEVNGTIEKLDLQLAKPTFRDNVNDLTGSLSGQFNLKNSDTNIPDINGELRLNNTKIQPKYLKTTFTIDDEKLTFSNKKILLDQFKIADENGNKALVNGNVTIGGSTDFKYQLSAKTTNFKLFNTTEKDNDLYYGKMLLDSDVKITGNENQYKVTANVSVKDNSNFTFIVPATSASVASHEDVVKFVDRDAKKNPFLEKYKEAKTDTSQFVIEGMDLQANVSVNENSKLSIIVDPETGDRLDLQGNADLTVSMHPGGNLNLAGRYEITKGKYYLNFYQLAKREFEIVEGSNVVWRGDPMDANLDVTARYRVETFPPSSNLKERLPFYVNLKIGGEIMKPELSFDISMPEDVQKSNPNIYTALQDINSQETELSTQVFSLILFNSFMESGGQKPEASTIVSNTARSSLSKILTQQLNRLAGNINAVDLDVNLQSYSTGSSREGQTDLELGLSKSLFNNRVLIRVSGNVNLGDQNTGGNSGTSTDKSNNVSEFAGDVFIEYKLSKNGEIRLQGFREQEVDGLTQGEIVKTGMGIILVKDYDNMKELFKRKDK